MKVNLSAANATVLQSAVAWGYDNLPQLSCIGVSNSNLVGIDSRVSRNMSFSPSVAADAFRLTFVAEQDISLPRTQVTDLMATLTAIASPRVISESARRFGTPKEFLAAFDSRLEEAQLALGTSKSAEVFIVGVEFAKPSWGELQTDLNPRPMWGGGASKSPSLKGPGVRAGVLQRAAELRADSHMGLSESDKKRLRRYRELVNEMKRGDATDDELNETLRLIWAEYADDLAEGGFLNPFIVDAVTLGISGTSVWEQTVNRMVETGLDPVMR